MMRPSSSRRLGAVLFAILLSLFAVAGLADAHAELETPTPADGATVTGSPPEIGATYSQAMTTDGSSLKLEDAAGTEVASGGVVAGDPTKMAIDPVPELAPGIYTVKSTTVSADDGDIDRTSWTFTVVAAASEAPSAAPSSPAPTPVPTTAASGVASPTPGATATPSASATPAPSSSPAPSATPAASAATDGTSTGSGSDVLLPILAALVIVAVIGGILYRRRDRSTPTQP